MTISIGSRVLYNGIEAVIQDSGEDEYGPDPCMICDDPKCSEWATLHTVEGQMLCHISECQMEEIESCL